MAKKQIIKKHEVSQHSKYACQFCGKKTGKERVSELCLPLGSRIEAIKAWCFRPAALVSGYSDVTLTEAGG
eukprot:127591-Pelagomonas_calceolata.AAC.1